MLHCVDQPGRSRAHLSRRAWLQMGGLGILGLSLPSLLRGEANGNGAPAAGGQHAAKVSRVGRNGSVSCDLMRCEGP